MLFGMMAFGFGIGSRRRLLVTQTCRSGVFVPCPTTDESLRIQKEAAITTRRGLSVKLCCSVDWWPNIPRQSRFKIP
jgi:hypothetical protein